MKKSLIFYPRKWTFSLSTLLLALLLSRASMGAPQSEKLEDGLNYDELMQELSQMETRYTPVENPFDDVKIHLGFGLPSSNFSVIKPDGGTEYGDPKGFQFSLGIDLLDPKWQAEGVVRSYSALQHNESAISLQEFDLKVAYNHHLYHIFYLRGGVGLAARYLDLKTTEYRLDEKSGKKTLVPKEYSYTTPTSIVFVGADSYVSENISLGGEFSFRSAMVDETIDRQSLDFTFRVDGHF